MNKKIAYLFWCLTCFLSPIHSIKPADDKLGMRIYRDEIPTLSEYLLATGSGFELEAMRDFISGILPAIPLTGHNLLMKTDAEYVLIGGMPGAVKETLSITQSFEKNPTAEVYHSRLIKAFRDDFAKYRKPMRLDMLRNIYDILPSVAGTTKHQGCKSCSRGESRNHKASIKCASSRCCSGKIGAYSSPWYSHFGFGG